MFTPTYRALAIRQLAYLASRPIQRSRKKIKLSSIERLILYNVSLVWYCKSNFAVYCRFIEVVLVIEFLGNSLFIVYPVLTSHVVRKDSRRIIDWTEGTIRDLTHTVQCECV